MDKYKAKTLKCQFGVGLPLLAYFSYIVFASNEADKFWLMVIFIVFSFSIGYIVGGVIGIIWSGFSMLKERKQLLKKRDELRTKLWILDCRKSK